MHPLRIVYESLLDCVIGFALIVAGLAFAVWLGGGGTAFWFTACFCIGMLPFAWFAKKRGSVKFSWWDYLAWAAFIFAISIARACIGDRLRSWSFAVFVGVSFGCFGWIYQNIRRRLTSYTTRHDSHG